MNVLVTMVGHLFYFATFSSFSTKGGVVEVNKHDSVALSESQFF